MAQLVELRDEVLSTDHIEHIQNFQCNEEGVEEFLKEHALRLQENNMTVTRLFFNASGELVGYFTLFNDAVPRIGKHKIEKEQWALPNSKFFPAIRLHYIGVDKRYTKQGIGHTMLMTVFAICEDIAQYSGCVFISVEALIDAVGFYENYDFKIIGRHDKAFHNMVFKLEEIEDIDEDYEADYEELQSISKLEEVQNDAGEEAS
jgi:GNAT superfamily N-acetyltransferase